MFLSFFLKEFIQISITLCHGPVKKKNAPARTIEPAGF